MQKLLTILLTTCLFTACQFDSSGVAAGSDDPADDFVCETDRSCQQVGFDCNVYSCNKESSCEVLDTTCEDGEVCTKDGCTEAPAAECQENYECTPDYGYTYDTGCNAGYCTADGACKSYDCGPSLCTTNDDCASDEECDTEGRCVQIDYGDCDTDSDCLEHDWSCYDRDCDGDTCGFVDTCESGHHCTADGCEEDTTTSGDLEINCDNVNGTTVTFSGDIKAGISTSSAGDLPGTPGKVSLAANIGIGGGSYWPVTGSGIDTANPACDVAVDGDGKWSCTSALSFEDSVQEFNFVIANDANTQLRYFRLSQFEVTGYCAKKHVDTSDPESYWLCSCDALPCSCD